MQLVAKKISINLFTYLLTLLHFLMRVTPRQLLSKIDAKFRTLLTL